jgi:predicted transposase/invertase (TIGR01784 family)
LPKFKPENRAEKKLHELWLRFLTEVNENTKEIPQELLDNEFTREAVGYMERSAYTKKQLETYDKMKIAVMTERSALNDALKKGLTEGEAIGLKKGKAEGKIEGKIEVVLNAHKNGLSLDAIHAITKLTKEEIEEILRRNGLL